MVKFLSVGLLAALFSTSVAAVDYQEHDGMLHEPR